MKPYCFSLLSSPHWTQVNFALSCRRAHSPGKRKDEENNFKHQQTNSNILSWQVLESSHLSTSIPGWGLTLAYSTSLKLDPTYPGASPAWTRTAWGGFFQRVVAVSSGCRVAFEPMGQGRLRRRLWALLAWRPRFTSRYKEGRIHWNTGQADMEWEPDSYNLGELPLRICWFYNCLQLSCGRNTRLHQSLAPVLTD